MKPLASDRTLLIIPSVAFLLAIVGRTLVDILNYNHGMLVYPLDDPYIHLALAEQLQLGHYGIHPSEYAAPSSSILWSFLLAPFASFEYAPLVINIVCSLVTVCLVSHLIHETLHIGHKRFQLFATSLFSMTFILASNMVGLIFIGMEHSLQVLLVCIIAYGLIQASNKQKVSNWVWCAIVLAPLVRYECAAISLAALAYLAVIGGYWKTAFLSAFILAASIIGFACFLMSMGLDPFPSSVRAKSVIVQDGGTLSSLLWNLKYTFIFRQGLALVAVAATFILFILLSKQSTPKRLLALVAVLTLCAHFVAGRYGWANRYEIYILAFSLIIGWSLLAPTFNFIAQKWSASAALLASVLPCFAVSFLSKPYIEDLSLLPLASNNIYEQQYQMHRFAVEYYNAPIAVNDLGYVSYKNPNYVLDLWGLGSNDALNQRLESSESKSDQQWMASITNQHNIGLAMIYHEWFQDLPSEWIKIGELNLGRARITPAGSSVDFYATSAADKANVEKALRAFVPTLPDNTNFRYTTP